MDTFDAIKTRRAIKKFDNTYKMSPEQVKSLMELTTARWVTCHLTMWKYGCMERRSYEILEESSS